MLKIRRLFFLLLICGKGFASSFIVDSNVWNIPESSFDYFGARPALSKIGIEFLPTIFWDWNWPTRGGIQTRGFPLYQYLFTAQLGVELEKLIKLKGGRLYLEFQYHQGQHPSAKYVGDWQGFDNINALNITEIGELWCQQFFFNKKAGFRFGKIDAYTLFNYTQYAQTLINNSFSQIPTIITFPSYPDQAVGVIGMLYPAKWLALKSGIFDGSEADGIETGEKGARRFFTHLGKHAFIIGEIDLNWGVLKDICPGNLGIGVWGLTATMTNFNGKEVHGTAGSYFFVAQTLWKEQPLSKKKSRNYLRDLGAFAQWGVCGKEVYQIKQYFGYGITFHNMSSSIQDSLSIGSATVLFSNATGADYPKIYEMSLEATYSCSFLNDFQVQPDFQYIIHPGGQGLPNAIVVTLRLVASI